MEMPKGFKRGTDIITCDLCDFCYDNVNSVPSQMRQRYCQKDGRNEEVSADDTCDEANLYAVE